MKASVVATALAVLLAAAIALRAQDTAPRSGLSVVLTRSNCFGSCPEYEVTIWGSGRVRYQGREFVRVKGVRERTIPVPEVQKLVRRLQEEHFFQWDESDAVCLDFPEVHISASLGSQRRHVVEGCNRPGKVLSLAAEIDRIAGSQRWVKKR